MYQRGETIRSISLTLGVSGSTVSKWVKRLGNSKQVRRLSKSYRSITVNITEESCRDIANQKVMSVYVNQAQSFYASARKKNDGQLSFDF